MKKHFTTPETQKAAKVKNRNRLQAWKDRGYARPSVPAQPGGKDYYTRLDVIELSSFRKMVDFGVNRDFASQSAGAIKYYLSQMKNISGKDFLWFEGRPSKEGGSFEDSFALLKSIEELEAYRTSHKTDDVFVSLNLAAIIAEVDEVLEGFK